MPHLHVGVKVADLLMFNKTVISNGFSAPIVDGDGWPVWGEKPGSENNPSDVVHVIIKVRGTKAAERIVKILPHTVPLPDGTIALLTSSINWGEVISVYPDAPTPAQQEIQEALDILKDYADGLGNEMSGATARNILAQSEAAYHTLKDALNL